MQVVILGGVANRREDRLMNSPFPGMDPFIEECGLWEDFHHHLVEKIGEQLADISPAQYLVRTGERSYLVLVESEGKEAYPFLPDVNIKAQGKKNPRKKPGSEPPVELAEDEPLTMCAFIAEEHGEAFVEIYEAEGDRRLVTCLEVLSPANKRRNSVGQEQYLRKRQSLLLEGVNLVEIDLLRGGERMPMLSPWPDCPYTLLVARAHKMQTCKVWRGHFRTRLPCIPVPLTKPDPDLALDLQPLIDGIYRRYRYAQSIDYSKPLKPALKGDDARWFRERLRERESKQ
jgi:hypothetical protein